MYKRCVMNDDQNVSKVNVQKMCNEWWSNVNQVNVQKMCNERWSKCKQSKCTKDV